LFDVPSPVTFTLIAAVPLSAAVPTFTYSDESPSSVIFTTYFCAELDFDAVGSDAEELDLFQANIDAADGGYLGESKFRYNGNTRRNIKIHSGRWTLVGNDVRKSSDFVADSGSTNAGDKNLNCIDWSNNGVGMMTIVGGYYDCSGYATGISNSGGQADLLANGVYLKGGTLRVIRTNPETGSPQDADHVGFYAIGSGGNGSGIVNSKIEGFTTAIQELRKPRTVVRDNSGRIAGVQ